MNQIQCVQVHQTSHRYSRPDQTTWYFTTKTMHARGKHPFFYCCRCCCKLLSNKLTVHHLKPDAKSIRKCSKETLTFSLKNNTKMQWWVVIWWALRFCCCLQGKKKRTSKQIEKAHTPSGQTKPDGGGMHSHCVGERDKPFLFGQGSMEPTHSYYRMMWCKSYPSKRRHAHKHKQKLQSSTMEKVKTKQFFFVYKLTLFQTMITPTDNFRERSHLSQWQ